jgi:hypothetical protein
MLRLTIVSTLYYPSVENRIKNSGKSLNYDKFIINVGQLINYHAKKLR